MDEESKQPKLNVRVPPDLNKRLEVARAQRGLEKQEAVWQALEMWLAKEGFKPDEKPRAPDPFPNLNDQERAMLARALKIIRGQTKIHHMVRDVVVRTLAGES